MDNESTNHSNQQQNNGSSNNNKIVVLGILRHYSQLGLSLEQAVANIQATEGSDALSMEQAQKCFELFGQGKSSSHNLEEIAAELFGVRKEENAVDLLVDKAVDENEESRAHHHQLRRRRAIISMLPTELWVETFSFLNVRSFLRLEQVNSQWHAIAEKHLWPRVRRLNAHVLTAEEVRLLACRFGPQIRSVIFGRTADNVEVPLWDVVGHMPQLHAFRVHHSYKEDLIRLGGMHSLRHADLNMNNSNYEDLPAILDYCETLNSLELSFGGKTNRAMSAQREIGLRVDVTRVPPRLKYLRAMDCGLFFPHLLERAAQCCGPHLRVLIGDVFFQTDFESMETAEALVKFKNLRFLRVGVELDTMKEIMLAEPDTFRPLRAFYSFNVDSKLLALLPKQCPALEHFGMGRPGKTQGRTTYRSLAHYVVRRARALRSLEVSETAQICHKWRLKCVWDIAQSGHAALEFLGLLIDMPFALLLLLIKNCPKLRYLNCFTIEQFNLDKLKAALSARREQIPLKIGIVNKLAFEESFAELNCSVGVLQIHKFALINPVEEELKQIEYDTD